jgi:hypothetical protein
MVLNFLEETKPEKMLNFPEIIQSWTRDEEKNVDIESTKNTIKN